MPGNARTHTHTGQIHRLTRANATNPHTHTLNTRQRVTRQRSAASSFRLISRLGSASAAHSVQSLILILINYLCTRLINTSAHAELMQHASLPPTATQNSPIHTHVRAHTPHPTRLLPNSCSCQPLGDGLWRRRFDVTQ